MNDGVLKFEPTVFGVANGRIEIYSTFDGSTRRSKVTIDARLRQLDLKRFLAKSSFAEKTIGPIGGRIALSGTGESFRELMATAFGSTVVMMSGGEISDLLVRLAGLSVARALGVMVPGDKPIPIRCALLDLGGSMDRWTLKHLSSIPPIRSFPARGRSISGTSSSANKCSEQSSTGETTTEREPEAGTVTREFNRLKKGSKG